MEYFSWVMDPAIKTTKRTVAVSVQFAESEGRCPASSHEEVSVHSCAPGFMLTDQFLKLGQREVFPCN